MPTAVQLISVIFLIVAVPIVFCMVTWVAATVYRIYFEDERQRVEVSPPRLAVRPQTRLAEAALPVGVREIKEEQRRRQQLGAPTHYYYAVGSSTGVPTDWIDDVWKRRN